MHLGEEGTEQFTVTTRVNGETVGEHKIHDPFIRTTIKLRGFKSAWRALFGLTVQVSLDASEGMMRTIMMLNPEEIEKETAQIISDRTNRRTQTIGMVAGECSDGHPR